MTTTDPTTSPAARVLALQYNDLANRQAMYADMMAVARKYNDSYEIDRITTAEAELEDEGDCIISDAADLGFDPDTFQEACDAVRARATRVAG